jgi:hypothetical protein
LDAGGGVEDKASRERWQWRILDAVEQSVRAGPGMRERSEGGALEVEIGEVVLGPVRAG